MMRLFQEHGVNPFASCLPLLLQFPVFISLFYLLQSDEFQDEVECRRPGVAGCSSTTSPRRRPGSELGILLVLYLGTSLAAGLISVGRGGSRQQLMIAVGLPVLFAPIMILYGFPAGLWVYWISTNVWTMGQQAVVKIFFPAPEQPTPEEVQASRPPPPPPRKRKRRR